jgi:hypothetical protein
MALIDIITQAAGGGALEQIGSRVGLTPAQTRSAAAALLPALAGGLKRQADGGLDGLLRGVGAGQPPEVASGNQILGQIFGSKDVSRTVAANAAESTGIGVDQMKALLPLLASLSTGALASHAHAGQGAASLLGLLDQDGDGDPLDDIMGMAGKLFGR